MLHRPPATGDPDRHLAELVRLQRVLTIRSAVYREDRTHMYAERVRPLSDEAVGPARRGVPPRPARGTRTPGRSLIDRSAFHIVARGHGPAIDDFRRALRHLGEDG